MRHTPNPNGPSKALIARIRRFRRLAPPMPEDYMLSDTYREVLRLYRALITTGKEPGPAWRSLVRDALSFLGGQADRHTSSLSDYDHRRYGPFLGVSDGGGSARAIRRAAFATPKTKALGGDRAPLSVGVALDAERLASVGEVPVGPDEFAQIWSECAGRTLMTTNVGSRANLRHYRRAPLVIVPAVDRQEALQKAQTSLAAALKPFQEAPGGPRPVVISVEFESSSKRGEAERRELLRALQKHLRSGDIADPRVHRLGLNVRIVPGQEGQKAALLAIDLAGSVAIEQVTIDGVVRDEAESVVSLPGLLNYLPPELVAPILTHARKKGIHVRTVDEVDPDTVARDIWASLNTARAMGLDLGKYGLFPLGLEECDKVVSRIQGWFPDWSAAPVFYVDQGIISRSRVYVGSDTARGIEVWLKTMARHKVRIVLIDTVDKSQGWKILKSGTDPKGILEAAQIARLTALGEDLGIKVLWAGGITLEQVYEFGRLGVFGIYVTTAASQPAPVGDDHRHDPALASEKRPSFEGVRDVKTILEAGFLYERLSTGSSRTCERRYGLRRQIELAGLNPRELSKVLPAAWSFLWREESR
jgi:hypothetical protein